MHVIVICKFHEDPTKQMKELPCSQAFSFSKPMEPIIAIATKVLKQFS